MSITVDDTDRHIIRILQKNVRATNRAIAAEVGVSDVTVAARIRRMIENHVLRTTVFYNVYALGYKFYCVGEIWIEGRSVRAAAREIAQIEALQTVVMMVGGPDISVLYFARDHEDADAVRAQIARIKGVKTIELMMSLKLAKFQNSYGAYAMLMRDE